MELTTASMEFNMEAPPNIGNRATKSSSSESDETSPQLLLLPILASSSL